jgi:HK97 family phage portal protein
MSFWSSLSAGVAQAVRWLNETPTAENGKGAPRPPKRHRQAAVTVERALSLSTFYRGVQIHATAACQLTIAEERDNEVLANTSLLIQQPDVDESLSAFVEYTVVSLYTDGNAFWRIFRNPAGEVVNLKPLDPNEVSVDVDYDRSGAKRVTYNYRGKTLKHDEVKHLRLLRVPGMERGLGPIQAAQLEVRGALDARDYGAMWLSDANMPDGVLTTDQELAPGDADKYRHVWYGRNPDGTDKDDKPAELLGERLRVLGKGLSYAPILLKPSDVQFLETQQYTTIQMARLIGAPASIMLVAVEGNSETYSNVEQEWIGYVRFSLMKPLREMEEALSSLLPGKRKARFKVDALLRSDTKTRYEAHAISLDPNKGWALIDEVRAKEGLPALTDAQRVEMAERRKTTPAKENANA